MDVQDGLLIEEFTEGFHEEDLARSRFMRKLLRRSRREKASPGCGGVIPKILVRYWHDAEAVPDDVRSCLDTWSPLEAIGFQISTYNDLTAAEFISTRFSADHLRAFMQCWHPAMRSDYFRLCYIHECGGYYVDADDVLADALVWPGLSGDGRLKLQPLGYDTSTATMLSTTELWDEAPPDNGRIFYVNNNPLVAPPHHPIIWGALKRATANLLGTEGPRDIQSITGPGNLTAVLASHARKLLLSEAPLDFELVQGWDRFAQTRWDLSYRRDERNWRNVHWQSLTEVARI